MVRGFVESSKESYLWYECKVVIVWGYMLHKELKESNSEIQLKNNDGNL